jgi:hypothetical protein
MPGGGPQTETIAITQGHLPHNAESPPAAPIAEYSLIAGQLRRLAAISQIGWFCVSCPSARI